MSVAVSEVVGGYINEFFNGVLVLSKPPLAVRAQIRKKRLTHRFRRILNAENIPYEKKIEILNKMISALPEETTKEAYTRAQIKIAEILTESLLKDMEKELEEVKKYITESELEREVKRALLKQKHLLQSLREELAEKILEAVEEELIVVDEAVSLAQRLFENLMENPEDLESALFLLILLVRIASIAQGKYSYDILYEDIAEILSRVKVKTAEVPAYP